MVNAALSLGEPDVKPKLSIGDVHLKYLKFPYLTCAVTETQNKTKCVLALIVR